MDSWDAPRLNTEKQRDYVFPRLQCILIQRRSHVHSQVELKTIAREHK